MPSDLTRRTFLTRAALAAAAAGVPALAIGKPRQQISAVATDFMAKHNVPGLSIAIAKDGRLVTAQGFGVANTSTQEPVTPDHVFRIASVSKPITSAVIFALVEAGKVRLTDTIFGKDAVLGLDFGQPPFKPYVADI